MVWIVSIFPDYYEKLHLEYIVTLCRFQSAILGRSNVYLNVDVLHKAFPSPIPILEFLKTINRGSVPNKLDDFQQRKLQEFLAQLIIGYRLKATDPVKTYGFNAIHSGSANTTTFLFNGREITIQKYFEQEKKIPLQFPYLPVL